MSQAPRVNRVSPLSNDEAKWTQLEKIETGRERVWESASRKTRSKGGIDAVAIAPILRYPKKAPSTLLILQYRPPVQATCVEFPAGLIDEGESPEEAAVRELKEETGYAGKVIDSSPVMVNDPGLTSANMKMVTIEINLNEGDKEPEQHLEQGEHIQRMIVPLSDLYTKLKELAEEEGKTVDGRLFHWAAGLYWSQRLK